MIQAYYGYIMIIPTVPIFFFRKTNKDSSFVAFLNKNNIRVYNISAVLTVIQMYAAICANVRMENVLISKSQ
jgi:hypothetical protein